MAPSSDHASPCSLLQSSRQQKLFTKSVIPIKVLWCFFFSVTTFCPLPRTHQSEAHLHNVNLCTRSHHKMVQKFPQHHHCWNALRMGRWASIGNAEVIHLFEIFTIKDKLRSIACESEHPPNNSGITVCCRSVPKLEITHKSTTIHFLTSCTLAWLLHLLFSAHPSCAIAETWAMCKRSHAVTNHWPLYSTEEASTSFPGYIRPRFFPLLALW